MKSVDLHYLWWFSFLFWKIQVTLTFKLRNNMLYCIMSIFHFNSREALSTFDNAYKQKIRCFLYCIFLLPFFLSAFLSKLIRIDEWPISYRSYREYCVVKLLFDNLCCDVHELIAYETSLLVYLLIHKKTKQGFDENKRLDTKLEPLYIFEKSNCIFNTIYVYVYI